MNHQRVLQALEEILPDIKKTGTPESVLLKYASDNNLSPAQLEKMAQTFNVAKALTYYDKAANRGGTFKVLDPASLVDQYKTPKSLPKAASAAPEVNITRFPGMSVLAEDAYPELTKAAGDQSAEMTQKQKEHLAKQARAEAAKSAFYAEDAKEFFRRQIADGVKELNLMFKRAGSTLDKTEFVDDVLYTFGKEAGEITLKQVFGLDYTAPEDTDYLSKRAFDKGMRTDPDRLKALDLAADVYDGMVCHKKACVMIDQLKKEADASVLDHLQSLQDAQEREVTVGRGDKSGKGITDPSNPASAAPTSRTSGKPQSPSAGGGAGKPTSSPSFDVDFNTPSGDLTSIADYIRENVVERTSRNMDKVKPLSPYRLLKDIADANAPSYNSAQESVDTSRREIEASTTIARLLQSDPIISEADPETVMDIFNTLQSANPELVRDPMSLRMALREALQYDAVPQHTIKELVDIRKTKGQAQDTENKMTSRSQEYRLGGGDRK